jgi:hypothetical protein
MAKKQTRRSISVSRATYDRLKAFCETNGISMSQFVENRVGDVLSHDAPAPRSHVAPAHVYVAAVAPPTVARPEPVALRVPVAPPLTSAAARIAIEPPPPVIKPKIEQPAPKPAEKRPDQIFTF